MPQKKIEQEHEKVQKDKLVLKPEDKQQEIRTKKYEEKKLDLKREEARRVEKRRTDF